MAAAARVATALSLAAVVAVVAVEPTVGWGDLAWVPLVAGLLLGLPHGAVDHLVPARRLGRRPPGTALFALGYAVVAVLAWLAFRAAPGPALLVFVALSVWHFGTGETAFADLRAGRPVQRQATASLVLGGLVLLVPLARGADDAAPVLAAVVPGAGTLPAAVPVTVLAVVLPAAAALAAERLLSGRWLEAAEVAVLLVLVLVVPPLAAFGVWFGCWHAVRHVARVLAADPAGDADPAAGRLAAPLRRFALAAALPTAAVLAVLAWVWSAADGWRGFLAAGLPLLAALTLPHALVVAWLDRAEGDAPAGRGPAAWQRVRPW
ncbi:Brp/Blh family beta-carotene 15,15'-dioxygenase [Geodermatophilus normandii]|uniref:Brp/Blh family beta-carotene 15,15'-dioxygenase n=1 Tax=Geodermatophilus normandii TaxID=1137989 RepID=UPI0014748722|nr:Brp/Blh family beta-carotene 15,15'-dioxygenase [Geodermatophilus normandii]